MPANLPQAAQDLLDAPTFVTLSTVADDGSPHSTVLWVKRDGGDVLLSTVQGRVKEKHLRRDPRVTVCFFDPANPYSYFTIAGTASMTTENGFALIDELSHKYMGKPYTWDEGTDNVQVIVRVAPERVYPS
ncbi:MAG: PPOX class F420-dependent oxidoreductase [Actinomycetota bacterium]